MFANVKEGRLSRIASRIVHGKQYNDKGGQGLVKIKDKLFLSNSQCVCSRCGQKNVVRTQVEKM